MNSTSEQCDVCVVGGGPGGSTAATFVAAAGHRVVLLEKDSLPIYKIGESLLPATIHGICSMLGVSEELKDANFIRKGGGTFRWGKNKEPWTFSFSESLRFQGPTSFVYQVERMKFDAILLNNARRKGVDVRERNRLINLITEADRVVGVNLEDEEGQQRILKARYIIDASGHTSPIGDQVSQRVYSESFRNIAVFGYYSNAARLPEPCAGNIFCCTFDKGWFWYIPLSKDLTSVGAVIGQEYGNLLRGSHEEALAGLVATCEPIRVLLTPSKRVTSGPYGKVRVRKDYSYSRSKFWRPGLALVGDSACFIDPVFSSGVHLATLSALLVARSINSCLAGILSEERAFGEFEARYRREYAYFYEFLTAFYDMDQDLDSYYWAARKATRSTEQGREAFIRLVAGGASAGAIGSSSDTPLLRQQIVQQLFPAALSEGSNGLLGNRSRSATSPFWTELNAEGIQMQLRGALKMLTIQEKPLIERGLVPSRDGLHWEEPEELATPRHG